MEQDLFYQR